MKTDDFDYNLPPELIAQTPEVNRQDSRMLVVGNEHAPLKDRFFSDLSLFCKSGDLIVVNDTRVIPARLICNKPSGGKVEVMLERFISEDTFLALAKSNKKLKSGQLLTVGTQASEKGELEYIERQGDFFKFKIVSAHAHPAHQFFNQYGDIPLPPYIKRQPNKSDLDRYQTVYAKSEGAVAAPTAGLHFDRPMLEKLAKMGVDTAHVTLHVGAGTFQPVKVDDVSQHQMHQEWIEVEEKVVSQIKQTKAQGGRVIAIGTTTVRALESAALFGDLKAMHGATDIFIYPGFEFKVVDMLFTNFHLPKSTLLMLVSAFAGGHEIKAAYDHAVEKQYRFFSYGDAMLLFPKVYSKNEI